MITFNFTLYRFVCDVTVFTSLSAPNADGFSVSDTSSFVCQWASVHRTSSSDATSVLHGATHPVLFKALGSDMMLSFRSHRGFLELDTEVDVITFFIKPSNFNGSVVPIVAKGTLDPRPYIGKPWKNYAIKLRDAAGQVIGKLLFALEVREVEEEEEEATGGAASRAKHRECKPPSKKLSPPDVKSEPGPHSTRNTSQDRMDKVRDRQEAPARLPARGSALCSPPTRGPKPTQCGPVSPDSHVDTTRAGTVVERLNIDLEKIVVKNEAIDLDNPPPLLLGGSYHLRVAFGRVRLQTPAMICQNPKEVNCSHRVSFILPAESGEKLRFSLWEDERQVGGFSLDPAKFRVSMGDVKEYSIPFRYFPTQHAASLDVTVHRSSHAVPDIAVMAKAEPATQSKSPPSSRQTQNYTENPPMLNSARCLSSECASVSNGTSTTSKVRRRSSAHDYVKKLYNDSNIRQTHWDNATGGKTVGREVHQPTKLHDNASLRHSEFSTISHQKEHRHDYERSHSQEKQPSFAANSRDGSLSHLDTGAPPPNGRVGWFLDQLAHVSRRSTSATRRPTVGLEVPDIVQNRQESTSRALGAPEGPTDSMRGGTPLRDRSGCNGKMSNYFHDDERGFGDDRKAFPYNNRSGSSSAWGSSPWRRHTSQSAAHRESSQVPMNEQGHLAESLLLHLERRSSYRTSLMDEWLDWRSVKSSSSAMAVTGAHPPSRTGSVRSAFTRDESIDSIVSRNRAISPLPTKSLGSVSEQRPFQPVYLPRSSSIGKGKPPLPMH